MSAHPVSCPDPTCNEGIIEVPDGIPVGEILECPECAAEVEVVNDSPYEVELVEVEK